MLTSTRTCGTGKGEGRQGVRGVGWAGWPKCNSACTVPAKALAHTSRPASALAQAPTMGPLVSCTVSQQVASPERKRARPHRLHGAAEGLDVFLVELIGVQHAGVARTKQHHLVKGGGGRRMEWGRAVGEPPLEQQ